MRALRPHLARLLAAALAVLGLCVAIAASADAHRAPVKKHPTKGTTHATSGIRDIPVTFKVLNNNTSDVSCRPDGDAYTVSGTLVLPAGATPQGITLYVHGLGYASYFWHFTAVPGYDYTTSEAQDGHASLIIDRLGYGASSIPNGDQTCLGSQATMLHEIIQDLRSGAYTATGTTAPSFSKVGLVGHSLGGELVEVEAYSYHDINALGVVEWADGDFSPGTYEAFGSDVLQCGTGGEDQVGSKTAGYAKFGETDAEYNALMFNGATPAVIAAADKLRTLDPCGVVGNALSGVADNAIHLASITVPIIYVHASADAIFPDQLPWANLQEALYTGTSKLTDLSLTGGHAVTLQSTTIGPFEAGMNSWLTANGL